MPYEFFFLSFQRHFYYFFKLDYIFFYYINIPSKKKKKSIDSKPNDNRELGLFACHTLILKTPQHTQHIDTLYFTCLKTIQLLY